MAGIELKDISKVYSTKNYEVEALKDVDLLVEPGSSLAIVGPSGSGKSTLLKIIGLLETPTRGSVFLDGEDVSGLNDSRRSRLRNEMFGYVVQDFAIIEDDTVYQNIIVPLKYSKKYKRAQWRELVDRYASMLGIGDLLRRKAGVLSGGEKQRVAIARAMVCGQPVILADEPTGSLDAENRGTVIQLLMDLVREEGKTLIIVTHDETIADLCDRKLELRNGTIERQTG